MKDHEDISESESISWMMTTVTVDDIYKLISKSYVEQEVWIPLDSLNFLAVLGVFYILKTTKAFRSTVFPVCSISWIGITNLIF